MNSDIKWLIFLGLERKLFQEDPCREIIEAKGDSVDIVTFAEELLQVGACSDFDAMQALVEVAFNESYEKGPPIDPFDPDSAFEQMPGDSEDTSDSAKFGISDMPELNKLDSLEAADDCLKVILNICQEVGASDLHLSAGARPFIRLCRSIEYLSEDKLTANASQLLNTALLSVADRDTFENKQDLDLALLVGESRYRLNLMVHKDGIAGSYRIVAPTIPELYSLGFDNMDVINKLLSYHNGLILLTGPVGAGKTTTLAAMIDELNKNRTDHLIIVEQPIEIVQSSKNCHITQREVGPHTKSYSSALKGALRQDPDIIVIGELRDLETIEMAISASETGHLVIGTLHTNNAANTLNRVLDVFPAAQQGQIRAMLAGALRGIICQNLIPAIDGTLKLAYEILISNTGVRNMISENKPESLKNAMETGASEGMQLMDKSVFKLWENGEISDEVAKRNLRDKMLRTRVEARM